MMPFEIPLRRDRGTRRRQPRGAEEPLRRRTTSATCAGCSPRRLQKGSAGKALRCARATEARRPQRAALRGWVRFAEAHPHLLGRMFSGADIDFHDAEGGATDAAKLPIARTLPRFGYRD
jgi:hypothetical protein